jgi:hypothetical protein
MPYLCGNAQSLLWSGSTVSFTGIVHYSLSEMQVQVVAELMDASPLASFGHEIDLIRQHKILAEQGCSFLVVEAPTEALADQVAAMVRDTKPMAAQHYGQFMIKNPTEQAAGVAPSATS